MRKLAPLFTVLFLLAVFYPAIAQEAVPQNSLIIEEGKVTFTGSSQNPLGQFTLAGSDLLVTGGLRDGFFSPRCDPCKGGDLIQIRSLFNGSLSLQPGTMTVAGTGRDIYFQGEMRFDSTAMVLPIRYSRVPFRVTVPITLQGYLEVHSQNPFNTNNFFLFGMRVSLSGTATLTLSLWAIDPSDGRPLYFYRGLSYDFPAVDNAAGLSVLPAGGVH